MIAKRPSIFIYTNNPNKAYLKEICAGIEEEGVFFEVFEKDGDVDSLAESAALDSMLGSGIGICASSVVLQIKGLPKGKNVEFYNMPDFSQCRKLGSNSARIIKKIALK